MVCLRFNLFVMGMDGAVPAPHQCGPSFVFGMELSWRQSHWTRNFPMANLYFESFADMFL